MLFTVAGPPWSGEPRGRVIPAPTSPRPAHSPSGALGAELQNSKTHLLTNRARRSQLRREGRHKHPEWMPFLQRQSPKKTHVKNKTSLQRKSLKKQHSSQKKKIALTISNRDKSILLEERKRSKLKGESKFSSEEGKAQYNIHRNRSRHLGGVPGGSVVRNPPAMSGM